MILVVLIAWVTAPNELWTWIAHHVLLTVLAVLVLA